MGIVAAIRRRLAGALTRTAAYVEPELPVADPYVLWRAAAERSARDRFTVKPEFVTAAGPDFDDPTITVTSTYPYDYASWADTVPASGPTRRTG